MIAGDQLRRKHEAPPAYAEQFAGLLMAGALGTFVAPEFAVRPR